MKIESVVKDELNYQSAGYNEQIKTSGVNFEQVSESTQFKTLMKKRKSSLYLGRCFFLSFILPYLF